MARILRQPTRRIRRGRVVILLILMSAAALLLPRSFTARVTDGAQAVTPFQDVVSSATDGVRQVLGPVHTVDEVGQRQIAALQTTVSTLAAQNQTLRTENERLTGVRGRGLGPVGRLIPCRVVADDSQSWRDSKLILGGTRRGVSGDQGVVSDHFSADIGSADGARSGLSVLLGERLIGQIEHASTYTSRVRLLSDPGTRMSVSIGRLDGSRFTVVDAAFWLVGLGRGRIQIQDVHHQYVATRAIQAGDVVLTPDDDPHLPPSLNIGTVSAIRPDPRNGLLYLVDVDPGVDLRSIGRVYVADTGIVR